MACTFSDVSNVFIWKKILEIMPVNAPVEYFKAEDRFRSAKSKEEKIAALEEMIRLLPKHHGSENAHAQLKSKLAKLKKETKKKGRAKAGIAKEGEAQVCLVGYTKSGKSWLLSKLTHAKPQISETPFTTTRPEVGMLDYEGVKIQIVEIPSTFEPEYLSIARSCDLVVLVSKGEDIKQLEELVDKYFLHTKIIFINPRLERIEQVREKIWKALDLMLVYTKKRETGKIFPMGLKKNSTVHDFAARIHKDFLKNFRFARILRKQNGKTREIKAGLHYKLHDMDIVELYTH